MRYLMLMCAEADAASGDELDVQACMDFDAKAKEAGVFVDNGALAPAATEAFDLMECPSLDDALDWANRLPTYGLVEVRELLTY
jgi:hypothetical protein